MASVVAGGCRPLAGTLVIVSGVLALLASLTGCRGPSPTPSSHASEPVITAASKPVPPIHLALAFRSERLRRHEDATLDLALTATATLPRVRARLRLPPQVQLTEGSPTWDGALGVQAREQITVRLRVVDGGRFSLGASAEILEGPYAGQVAGAVLYVDATGLDVRWSHRSPD